MPGSQFSLLYFFSESVNSDRGFARRWLLGFGQGTDTDMIFDFMVSRESSRSSAFRVRREI